MRENTLNYTLFQLIKYFLKLGTIGFGGPVALVGYMHKDLVEEKKWISENEYKEGLAISQLVPGPLAAQLAIYLGFIHYRVKGATLVGLAFVAPSFIMVLIIGYLYKLYGGIPSIQAVFYGVSAAVFGIIASSTYKLTIKSIGKLNVDSIIKHKWQWIIFTALAVHTAITKSEDVLLILLSGFLLMVIQSPPKIGFIKKTVLLSWLFETSNIEPSTVLKVGLFFLKAGTFVFGSGLAIVPFLHSGVVLENHWLSESEFIDAVAVAMITPGPVVITVGFIGYLISGFWGACIAALATFLPCYLLTVIIAPYFHKIATNNSLKTFIDGITAAVVGALFGAVWVIAKTSIIDIPTLIIAITTILILIYSKKIKEPIIILIAAALGIIIKQYMHL